MNFVTVSVKCILPEAPVVLTKSSEDGFSLVKAANEVRLNALDIKKDNILAEIGSSIGNVIFIFNNELQIDPLLGGNTVRGTFEFKELEQTALIDVTRIVLGKDEVLSYHFDDIKTARRFIDKKILGEFYLLKSGDERLVFYPQFKEAYLFASNSIEVGVVGFVDCGNTISAPSATITELTVESGDKKTYEIGGTGAVFEIPVWKRYRLDFTPGSGLHIVRMNRGMGEVKGQSGNGYWKPQDEILKIYVCEG